jgi:hypothetical protein
MRLFQKKCSRRLGAPLLLANLELRARLAEVDASIAELKLRLKVLEDIRLLNQRRLDGVVYPVLTLPPEITSEIFLQCLPLVPDLSKTTKEAPKSSDAPLLLLQICQMWRSIAFMTPPL